MKMDLFQAISQCDGIWVKKTRRWVDCIEKGEALRFEDAPREMVDSQEATGLLLGKSLIRKKRQRGLLICDWVVAIDPSPTWDDEPRRRASGESSELYRRRGSSSGNGREAEAIGLLIISTVSWLEG